MITKLRIQNFQSHKKTELNLHAGINVIQGDSTTGKTAIMRAFRWLLTNRPLGDRFRSVFAKDRPVEVSATMDNGIVVTAKKAKSMEYAVDGNTFKGGGAGVPDVVLEALNINEINLQDQLDEHFLITASPAEVARVLNKITNIEKVDLYVSAATTAINTVNKGIGYREAQVSEKQEQLKQFDNLEAMDRDITLFEELNAGWKKAQALSSELKSVVDTDISLQQALSQLPDNYALGQGINALQQAYGDLIGIAKDTKEAESYIVMAQDNEKLHDTICDARDTIEELDKELYTLQALFVQLQSTISVFNNLEKLTYNIGGDTKAVATATDKFMWKKTQFAGYLEAYKLCPLCQSPISHDNATVLVDNLVGEIK